jgi:PPK2 family polyphosphate:nucleotide phosphotransferase
MTALSELLRVGPDRVDLAAIDPRGTPGLPKGKRKKWARSQFAEVSQRLATYQEMLFAQAKVGGDRRRLLLLLQAMDCGGKDGTTKQVAGAMNPAAVRVTGFGKPTDEELRHHFLWRIRKALPPPGWVGVFNRSHYEDVLVVRVHNLVPARTWRARYAQINRFEQELVDDGVTLVKVMLHISPEEQLERLAARLDDPTKHWKYNPDDLDERARWADYQAAYADALAKCSTDAAPWYVVPADRKWYRDWAVSQLLLEAFAGLDLEYPKGEFDEAAERERLNAAK